MQERLKRKKLMLMLGEIIQKHRILQNKTIYSISAECSLSKSTWREAEIGCCNDINLTTLWKISEGLNIKLNILIEELITNLGKDFSLSDLD